MYDRFKVLPCGDRAVILEFGDGIDLETNRRIRKMFMAIRKTSIQGMVETVPCYRSLLVYYDPLEVDVRRMEQGLREIERDLGAMYPGEPKRVEIPVVYGGEFGPDIGHVADYHQMTIEKVIELHTRPIYLNSMYGFDPGFVLLIGLPLELETPRMENPRLKVPVGSVGIGAAQTGIYPFERAGGWHLIGRTPAKMFDLNREPQILVDIGDEVKFVRISEQQYDRMIER